MKKIYKKIPKPILWLTIFALVFLLGRTSAPVEVCPPPIEEIISINEEEIIKEINLTRTTNKLATLRSHPLLEKSAQLKADDMARRQYFAHNAPDGKTPWKFFDEAGYRYIYAGENLAKNFLTVKGVVFDWLKSPKHKDIMLDPRYKEIGIGQSLWDGSIVLVAHFARR